MTTLDILLLLMYCDDATLLAICVLYSLYYQVTRTAALLYLPLSNNSFVLARSRRILHLTPSSLQQNVPQFLNFVINAFTFTFLREIIGNKREIKLISATVLNLPKLDLSILSKSKSADVRYSNKIRCKSHFYSPDLYSVAGVFAANIHR